MSDEAVAPARGQGYERRWVVLALAGTLLLTAVAYAPVLGYGVINYDDPGYVVDNVALHGGLRLSTVRWAFRSLELANWHPLTWLSHALDWQLYGPRWGGHHATSLALHLAMVAVVFLALERLTGAAWRSLAVAAVFAVHPINVQSVAWISERKNVLSGLCFALTLVAYASYARRRTRGRYLAVTALFALGLMAKPMLVTTPMVLLLLDVWPLGRLPPLSRGVIVEKLPWLAMAAASSIVTVHAQRDALETLQESSVPSRVCSALGAYFGYLEKLVWPAGFAVLYPKPSAPCFMLPVGLAVATLFALSVGALLLVRRRPYAVVGWLWFVGTLVPVSGLFQVGGQLMADRYAYIPMLGLFLATFWLVADLGGRSARGRQMLAVATVALVAVLAQRTRVELGYWKDSFALFSRALAVTKENCIAYNNVAIELRSRGQLVEAARDLERAVGTCPGLDFPHANLASLMIDAGDLDHALPHLVAAAQLNPKSASAQYNLGVALWYKGRKQQAAGWFERALQADPHHDPSRQMLRRIHGEGPAPGLAPRVE